MRWFCFGTVGFLSCWLAGCGAEAGNAEETSSVDQAFFGGHALGKHPKLGKRHGRFGHPPKHGKRDKLLLRNKRAPVFFEGSVGPEEAPSGGEPPECQAVACDHHRLKIDLPRGTFRNPNRPGGVQVAVRWASENDALNLFVYRRGELVASSTGIIATAQSALIPAPDNGVYDIWVAHDPEFSLEPAVAYEALAEVEFAPRVRPVRPLLPDLSYGTPVTVTFDTPSFPLFEPEPPPGASCFESEVLEDGAQNCLRFDQKLQNIGRGSLELRLAIPLDPESPAMNVFQRVFNSDGSAVDRLAGNWLFHERHQRFRFESFGASALWQSNANGARLGSEPVRTGKKLSFCVVDVEIALWGEKGDGPRTYQAPDCLFPQASDEDFEYLIQGITHGWTDVYEWYLPDQYIEVTGVPDGFYQLESCADPDNEVLEEREDNNCGLVLIRLTGMGTPDQRAENLGPVYSY
jgi:hypothetical protein